MGMTLGVYKPTPKGNRPIGFLPYKFYGYRDASNMDSIVFLCNRIRESEDITPEELSVWFCDSPICTVAMTVEEACIFVGLYVADLIRYRAIISPESVLGHFADIIIKLSKMSPDDVIELCWC